jgi:SAM-dependent methyltransferase
MQRILEPELLDTLPVDHPDARHSRRDLRLTNRFLGTHRWIERTLPGLLRPGERVLEIGAGTGELGRRLNRKGLTPAGLDLWPRPAEWPAEAEWHRADLRTFSSYDRYAAIVANLILHHFSDADLAGLGSRLRRTARVIVACEPARRRVSQLFFRTLAPWFGANAVTLHDAHVSIAAGFIGEELPRLLGLDPANWQVRHATTRTGVYRLTAVRRDAC